MNNLEYWTSREKSKLDNSLKDVDKLEKLLEKEYKKASKEIEKEISVLFSRYATDNKLSYTDATRYLTSSEFKEWRYDLKEYMSLIKATGDERLLLELNTLAMKSRIDRLSLLKYQVDKNINNLYVDTLESTTKLLTDTFADNYYKTIYDVHKFIGVGASFALVDDEMIRNVLSFPWSGENYSQRIWNNREKLKMIVRSEMTQMITRGESARTISKRVAEKMDTSLFNARRLINTEHSYVMSEATCKAFKELDIEKYEFLATLDKRTSVICQSLDGKVFNLKDRVVGVNASPLHCFCRSTELPVIDDDYIGTRIARDKNGQNIEVPSDMNYNQWHDEFVKGVKSDYKPKEKKVEKVVKDVEPKLSDINYLENKYGIKINITDNAKDTIKSLPKEYFEALNGHIDDLYTKYPKLQGEAQALNYIEFDIYSKRQGLASYGYNSNSMTINLSNIRESIDSSWNKDEMISRYVELTTSTTHEIGHYVDNMISRSVDKSLSKWNTDKEGNFTSYYDNKEYSMKKLKGQLKKKGWTLSKKERFKELGDYAETDLAEMMAEGWGYTKTKELISEEWFNDIGKYSKHKYDSALGKDIVEIYEGLLDNHFK